MRAVFSLALPPVAPVNPTSGHGRVGEHDLGEFVDTGNLNGSSGGTVSQGMR